MCTCHHTDHIYRSQDNQAGCWEPLLKLIWLKQSNQASSCLHRIGYLCFYGNNEIRHPLLFIEFSLRLSKIFQDRLSLLKSGSHEQVYPSMIPSYHAFSWAMKDISRKYFSLESKSHDKHYAFSWRLWRMYLESASLFESWSHDEQYLVARRANSKLFSCSWETSSTLGRLVSVWKKKFSLLLNGFWGNLI